MNAPRMYVIQWQEHFDNPTGRWDMVHRSKYGRINFTSLRTGPMHVARMGETRNAQRIFVRIPIEKRPLARRTRWEDTIKMEVTVGGEMRRVAGLGRTFGFCSQFNPWRHSEPRRGQNSCLRAEVLTTAKLQCLPADMYDCCTKRRFQDVRRSLEREVMWTLEDINRHKTLCSCWWLNIDLTTRSQLAPVSGSCSLFTSSL
jgi:hypothetical protein